MDIRDAKIEVCKAAADMALEVCIAAMKKQGIYHFEAKRPCKENSDILRWRCFETVIKQRN